MLSGRAGLKLVEVQSPHKAFAGTRVPGQRPFPAPAACDRAPLRLEIRAVPQEESDQFTSGIDPCHLHVGRVWIEILVCSYEQHRCPPGRAPHAERSRSHHKRTTAPSGSPIPPPSGRSSCGSTADLRSGRDVREVRRRHGPDARPPQPSCGHKLRRRLRHHGRRPGCPARHHRQQHPRCPQRLRGGHRHRAVPGCPAPGECGGPLRPPR